MINHRPQDIIRKKRDGEELSREEISFFVKGATDEVFADYQAAALLMAIFLNGMSEEEQFALTQEMLHSGEVLSWSDIEKPISDKHSTGGVGDKTSLIIAPLAAASGVAVPMISGRGLGHTGGTLDKLESIEGYRVRISIEEFRSVLKKVGFAMLGQTENIAPADRKLYALRDATSTVETIPLIVGSIMSKKLAAGLQSLVLDVKTGSGAFMQEFERSKALAEALVKTGNSCGVKTQALITDMNQPLGYAVGHANEVEECILLMRGERDERALPTLELSIELTARMVAMSHITETLDEARELCRQKINSGEALEKFKVNIEAQGGDPRVCDKPSLLKNLTLNEVRIESPHSGFVQEIDTKEIGNAICLIGGGRVRVEDTIDHSIGFFAEVKIGDQIKEGDTLGLLYCRNGEQAATVYQRLQSAYKIGEVPPSENYQLIKTVID
jgi:pyrimidine-nucleoside phosphorylase/thymidine phosphorylase